MITLDSTTDSLEIKLGGAVTTTQLPFTTSYADLNTSTFAVTTFAENDGTSNNTTAVTLVAAPGASRARKISLVNIYNADTVAATVTVQYNANATLRVLVKIVLAVDSTLTYADGAGWQVMDSTGAIKTATTTQNHVLLDGSIHSDTAADSVTRGSLIYGNITPAWDELVIGAANRVLGSDGTDAAWVQADHGAALTGLGDNDHPQYLLVADIDDTPVNGEIAQPISSNWAFDHEAAADPHTGYRLESADHTHQSTGAQAGQLDHGLALTGLTDDDHTQYALLAGRSGGQIITGGTAASDDLTLRSTSNATKGDIIIADAGGDVIIGGGATASNLRLLEASASGTNYTEFRTQPQAASITYILPADDGDADQVLSTNGSGTLDWVTPATSVTISGTPADNYVGVWTSATALEGPSTLQYDGNILFVNDSTNVGMTTGLTINQGAADNEIIAMKSSDIAHGITSRSETDTFLFLRKYGATTGGVTVYGLSSGEVGIHLVGSMTSDDTGKATTANAAVQIEGLKKSGTGDGPVGTNANLLAVMTDSTTRFILDGEGDSHQDVGTAWTNFDSHDDVLVLDSLSLEVSQENDPWKEVIRQNFANSLDELISRKTMEDMKLVSFNEDGHHFVNMSKLAMLHTGAIRQLSRQLKDNRRELNELKAKLLFLEKGT